MFKVLSDFADLQDNNHIYRVGDVYPRAGYTPSENRLEELSTNKNRVHKPLISEIVVEKPEPVAETVTEKVAEEPVEVVEKPATRGRRKAKDVISNADSTM